MFKNRLWILFLLSLCIVLIFTGCSNKVKTVSSKEAEKMIIKDYFPPLLTRNQYISPNDDGTNMVIVEVAKLGVGLDNDTERIIVTNNYQGNVLLGQGVVGFLVSDTEIMNEDGLIFITNKPEWESNGTKFYFIDVNKTVEVKAGVFKNCIEVVRIEPNTELYGHFTYAPNVGLIKITLKSKDKEEKLLAELTSTSYEETIQNEIEESNSIQNGNGNADDLYDAVLKDNLKVVKSLIDDGVNIDSKNEYGITALMEASRLGHINMVKLLLNEGADPNEKAMNTETALLWAVDEEYTDIIELLINAGADTNIKGEFDRTPLWVACKLGNVEIVKILLENGANPNLKLDNEDGSTPLSVAQDKGIAELVELLKGY